VQRQLLHPQIADLANIERIYVAAVNGIDRSELLQQLAGPAKLAGHRPVQTHSVDFTVAVNVVWRIGIRDVNDLIRSLRYAKRLRISHIRESRFKDAVIVEDLDAIVSSVRGIYITLHVNRDASNIGELAGCGSFLAPGLHELAVFIELRDARIAQAVSDEDVPGRIPGYVGGTVEEVSRLSRAISRGLTRWNGNGFRFSAEQQGDAPLRVELITMLVI
jgi:hypothetical protein